MSLQMTHITAVSWLSSTGGSAPLRQFALPPKLGPKNNRKISITKEICITKNFASPEKIPGRKPFEKVGALWYM